jgi:LmbE family N-acetylglucosaminyl deacetylase
VTRLTGRTVLAVFAHPDDESIACGGTLARMSDEGAHVILVCASRGERGSIAGPARDEELAEARSQELRDAATTLGVAEVLIFDHPDGDLRWAHVSELHAQLLMTVRHYSPDAVITFGEDGLYWHVDHIAVHERTTTALLSLGPAAPPLYYVTMPRGIMRAVVDAATARGWTAPPNGFWSLSPDAFGEAAAPPSVVVHVEDWVLRKLAAIRCHRSQMGAGHPFANVETAEVRRWLGTEYFRRARILGRGGTLLEDLGNAFA